MNLLGLFLFVLAAVTAAGYWLVLRPARASETETAAAAASNQAALEHLDLPWAQAALIDIFRLLGEAMPGGATREQLRQHLLKAGYRWPSAVSIFMGIKAASATALGVAALMLAALRHLDFAGGLTGVVASIGFGYLLPDRVLHKLAVARAARLRRALPAALDLLVLAMEAGQALDAAVADTSRGLRATHPDLASEFVQLRIELRTDISRADALRNFGERSGDQEVRKFCNLLIDTDRFGTSVGPALKTHARYLRIRYRQLAQERARKVGVKLIFPIFFLIFPSVLLVTLGPAVIQLMGQLDKLFGM
jgi:tight adherence protein C